MSKPRQPQGPASGELETRFRQSVLELMSPRPGLGLVVALSGGIDSTALLYLSRSVLAGEFGLRLTAAHLDHGLRGGEGQRDREAVESLAKKLGVPFVWEKRDCRALADSRSLSLEEAAREARYDFLVDVGRTADADFIATGHTADDNAEVVLLNLLRGAGPRGLAGIPPRRKEREIAVIRPLLKFWRDELRAFLLGKQIKWVEDSSNLDPAFTRNRIRHHLLPLLAGDYNPGVKAALVRTADIIRLEEAAWTEIIDHFKGTSDWTETKGRVHLTASKLAGLNPGLQRRLIRAAIERVAGTTRSLTYDHVEDVLKLVHESGLEGSAKGLDLPGRLRVRLEPDRLIIGPTPKRPPPAFKYGLSVPGRVVIKEIGHNLRADIRDASEAMDLKSFTGLQAALDPDSLSPPLTVRSPRPGDRFQPLGMRGTKKLQDFFTDAHVPARKRRETPLVTDSQGIVWVGGFRISHRARMRPDSERVLILTLEPSSEPDPPAETAD